ncbi:response regulator transcription factor [Streptomyces tailanensis]|uniref:response regulator transcription factor n=1 Tax=Streptomyces tailanensis TaxID=2569858 RepID=UPI00122E03A5|nr:response regulator transcription factor [Streptomyces tailanensis]
MSVVRVLLACENKLLQDAVAGVLSLQQDIQVLGAAGVSETVGRAVALHPHVVVLAPWATPVAARTVQVLRRAAPRAAVLVFGAPGVSRTQIMAAGAHRYLPEGSGQEELLSAVREFAETHAAAAPVPQPDIRLSPRQQEVLALAAEALSNKQIARSLDISIGTVKRHLHVVFQKLGAVSRLDAVARAHAAGLLSVVGGPAAAGSRPADRLVLTKI